MALSDREFEYLDKQLSPANDLGMSLDIATRRDPAGHAENLALSQSLQLPVDTVERNKDEVKRLDRLRMLDPDSVAKTHPKTAAFMADPDNASIALNDLDVLKGMEAVLSQPRPWYSLKARDLNNLPETSWESFKQGIRGVQVWRQDLIRWQNQWLADNVGGDELKQFVEEADPRLEDRINDIVAEIEAGNQRIEDLTPDDMSILASGVRSGFDSTIRNLPGLAASIAARSPAPMLATMGAQTGFESYGSARAKGKTPLAAAGYAGTDAAIEVATELLPAGKLVDMVGGGKFAKDALGFVVSEIGGEQIATLGQSLNAYAHDLDEELDNAKSVEEMLDIQAKRQAVTLVASVVGSGTQLGTVAGVNIAANALGKKSADYLEQTGVSLAEQQVIDQVSVFAQSANIRDLSPERFGEFMQKVGADREVFIPADIAQQIPDAPAYITEQLDGTGVDVTVPLDKFATDIVGNPEWFDLVRPHIRLSADSLSQADLADGDNETIHNLLGRAEQESELRAESDRIYEQVKDQLVETGRQSESTARLSAQIIPAYVATKAERLGISPREIYQSMGLRIEGPGSEQDPGRVLYDQPAFPVEQDFTGLVISEEVTVAETGETVTMEHDAQRLWEQTHKRRSMIAKLGECLGG